MLETITYEVHDRIARIMLNRPERMNAISPQMREEISQAIDEAERDDAAGVILVAGAGRGFCAGADHEERGDQAPASKQANA